MYFREASLFMGWGIGIYTNVVVKVVNYFENAFMMVHHEECEEKNKNK